MRRVNARTAVGLLAGVALLASSGVSLAQVDEIPDVCYFEPDHTFLITDENREICEPFRAIDDDETDDLQTGSINTDLDDDLDNNLDADPGKGNNGFGNDGDDPPPGNSGNTGQDKSADEVR